MKLVVVGAGIAGLSVAHALARRGLRPLVVATDHGASAESAGIVSAQLRDPDLFALARRSQEIVTGLVPVHRCGLTQLALSPRAADALEGTHGAEERLPAALAAVLRPEVRRRIVRALFSGEDLWLRPRALLRALLRGQRRLRATVRSVEPGRVETDRGVLEADHIVVAAGAASLRLTACGELRPCQAVLVRAPAALPTMLHVVDSGFYARPEGRGCVAGNHTATAIARHLEGLLPTAPRCRPLATATVLMPSHGRPVLFTRDGITVFTGLGGDGFALAPALAERVAAMLVQDRSTVIDPLLARL